MSEPTPTEPPPRGPAPPVLAPRGAPAHPGEDEPEVNGLALVALFLALIWLFGIGSIVGTYLAIRALKEIRESEGRQEGRSLALMALAAGVAGFLSLGFVIVIAIQN